MSILKNISIMLRNIIITLGGLMTNMDIVFDGFGVV